MSAMVDPAHWGAARHVGAVADLEETADKGPAAAAVVAGVDWLIDAGLATAAAEILETRRRRYAVAAASIRRRMARRSGGRPPPAA